MRRSPHPRVELEIAVVRTTRRPRAPGHRDADRQGGRGREAPARRCRPRPARRAGRPSPRRACSMRRAPSRRLRLGRSRRRPRAASRLRRYRPGRRWQPGAGGPARWPSPTRCPRRQRAPERRRAGPVAAGPVGRRRAGRVPAASTRRWQRVARGGPGKEGAAGLDAARHARPIEVRDGALADRHHRQSFPQGAPGRSRQPRPDQPGRGAARARAPGASRWRPIPRRRAARSIIPRCAPRWPPSPARWSRCGRACPIPRTKEVRGERLRQPDEGSAEAPGPDGGAAGRGGRRRRSRPPRAAAWSPSRPTASRSSCRSRSTAR